MRTDSSHYRRHLIWFATLATVGCLLDLVTKHFVFASPELFPGSEWWLINGHVGIQKSLNEGALFGMGQGKVALFAAFSVVAAIAIPLWLICYRAAEDFWVTTALGAVMAGVMGNFYDRLGLSGLTWDQFDPTRAGDTVHAVRDWILVQANDQWVWPNFNLADAFLVCGATLLFAHSFFAASIREEKKDR